MNKSKVTEYDYIDFLIGTRKVYSCTEAERVQPGEAIGPSRDAFTRQLHRLFPTADRLRPEAENHVDPSKGYLIGDDSTSDKLYSRKIEPATRHRSGRHKKAVSGINLLTLLRTAAGRGFRPEAVLFDSRYSGPENLELVRSLGRRWPTRLKHNRHVDPDRTGNRPVREVDLSGQGDTVHLKGYGLIRMFRTAGTDDGIEYRATDDLRMNDPERLK